MSRSSVALWLSALLLLAGCATSVPAPPERAVVVAGPVDEVLETGVEVLIERGFVIRLADAELGRVDAVRAARPGYVVRLEASAAASGTRLALSGRRGGSYIDPWRFDTLLAEIAARVEARQ
ncbi:hypothetical protein SAMN05661010_01693 [Modicisalibacter muralis]|uniref:Lipoprotein n=1 Tax=Modicisalibacter muralis TaxID=119000 RepID=A0A1G9K076_9GAMM|nr:hypothetical protein [Halomonas muralis]SDL43082.1 hypothetical protein SAMN05661010_01693 [Halomonas muralis]